MQISCHAVVFSEFGALTAFFLPATFSDLTMTVVQRPAAAPRGVMLDSDAEFHAAGAA